MNDLQLQLDITRDLLESLDKILEHSGDINNTTQSQAAAMTNLAGAIGKANNSMKQSSENSQKIVEMTKTIDNNAINKITSTSNQLATNIQKSLLSLQEQTIAANKTIDIIGNRSNSNILRPEDILRTMPDILQEMQESSNGMSDTRDEVAREKENLDVLDKIYASLASIKDAVLSGGVSLFKDTLSLLFGAVSAGMNMFAGFLGAMSQLFKFTMTLPFTIAKMAVGFGNSIRSAIVETIQAGGEEAKESFDLTSRIGKSADKMTQTVKGLMKTFDTPRSRLSKLFNKGSAGASAFLTETFKAVDSMGHYAENFGPSILGSTENAQYLIEMQKAMGLGAQEMAYYALQAYTSGKHPIDTLHETSQIIKRVADENDVDFKAIGKEYHKLKANITEFGHLTGNEIGNLVNKLRKMKVKTDDAVNVFKKFTSFEEAAKASAMLFQAFEMNIDAFDLLTARNPGEMLTQFRNAMFQTGKSFKELDRHEKVLMSSITGISEQGLSTLMNYMDLNYTYEEARKKVEAQDPTKEHTKMIKGLSSTIKLFQKIITFNSPFSAFYQGMMDSQLDQNKLQTSLISLSKVYADLRSLGASMNMKKVNILLKPVTKALRNIDALLTSKKFKAMLKLTTKTAGDFLEQLSYDIKAPKDLSREERIKKKDINKRIDDLFSGLLAMFNFGAPIFKNFLNIGGKIMGSIIKGAILGITAAFHMLAGGVDKTVKILGETVTEAITSEASKKGINKDKYTMLNWLGIDQAQMRSISIVLGKEIKIFVESMPTMMSMAGTLLGDVRDVFVKFAFSVIGVLSDFSSSYYEESNAAFQTLMLGAGFNYEKTRQHKMSKSLPENATFKEFDELFKTKHIKGKNKKHNLNEGMVGDMMAYINNVKESYHSESFARKFLESSDIASRIKDVGNSSNFSRSVTPREHDNKKRTNILLDILSKSKRLDFLESNSDLNQIYNDDSRKSNYKAGAAYKKTKKQMFEFTDSIVKNLPSVNSNVIASSEPYSNVINESTIDNIKRLEKESHLNKSRHAKDTEYTGKNAVLMTPKATFYLDDHDSVLAAKKGGFLNKLFIELTEHFKSVTDSNIEAYNKSIEESNENITIAKVEMNKLNNAIIKRDEMNHEASEEDIIKLFNAYDDIVNIVSSRKIIAKSAQISVSV